MTHLDYANLHGSLAHMDAFNAGILHRDLSVGNIIIDSAGKGRLIDWDLSKPVAAQASEIPRRATRTVRFIIPLELS
jgi:RIO-like serine/threonine protein kinase